MKNEQIRPTVLAVDPATHAEILEQYRIWCEARQEWLRLFVLDGNSDANTPDMVEADNRERSSYQEIIRLISVCPMTPPVTAIMAHLLWDTLGPSVTKDDPEYADQLEIDENRILIGTWQVATGLEGEPRAISL